MNVNNELDPFLFLALFLGLLTVETENPDETKENECTQKY
ncbi:hypothetical protein HNR50_000483 [Spirochaeta isovalerica]|uniref:Uncharacterized protein n=1 Tax=Spirochaeta isovalerica TaxID=150 RepID=A0A841R731_9SPIO|nr:hypothetical protein [Spirochaeta isovalerica]